MLIKAGANVHAANGDRVQAMILAAKYGHVSCLKLLVEAGGDVNCQCKRLPTPLYNAAWHGQVEAVGIESKISPLHIAVQRGHSNVVTILIGARVDLNERDHDGNTALHYAAQQDQDTIIKALCEAGASINITHKKEQIPLWFALNNEDDECVYVLVTHGSRVTNIDGQGYSALCHVIDKNRVTLINLLSEHEKIWRKVSKDKFTLEVVAMMNNLI